MKPCVAHETLVLDECCLLLKLEHLRAQHADDKKSSSTVGSLLPRSRRMMYAVLRLAM
jgi:hypothetical protein